jgi:hypothetical protein
MPRIMVNVFKEYKKLLKFKFSKRLSLRQQPQWGLYPFIKIE